MPNIFINTSPLLGPRTGIGNYTLQIAQRVMRMPESKITFFDGDYTQKLPINTVGASGKQPSLIRYLKRFPHIFNKIKEIHGLIRASSLKKRHFDLYFEPAFIPLSVPAKRLVITVHDFSFHLHRDWHPLDRVLWFEKHFWSGIKKAHHFIFISDFIRNSAIDEFGFDPSRCTTIHCGVDHSLFYPRPKEELEIVRQRYDITAPFILFTGSVEPRKNLKGLLKAYISLPEHIHRDIKLLIVGFSGWQHTEIMQIIQTHTKDIRYLGYVPKEDLACLYNLAEVFVYPSFYEGFGLPPLEAMACGTPVIVSNTSAMPEVCGDGAIYVNPDDMSQLTQAILTLLEDMDMRKRLAKQGENRAAMFSWDKAAESHINLFQKILMETD